MKSEITPLTYEEFGAEEQVVRVGSRFIDQRDEQFTIPKVSVPSKVHQEINRFDGQKIFVGKNGLEEIAQEEQQVEHTPVVLKSRFQKRMAICEWNIYDLHKETELSGMQDQFTTSLQEEKRADSNSQESLLGLQEAKGLSREIIESAKREAQAILDQAHHDADQVKRAAYQEGFQEGVAQVNSQIELLRSIQKSMHQTHDALMKEGEGKIIEMIKLITQKLFIHGMALDANLLKDVVARAINEASRLGNLKVYLNPADLEKLQKLWRESELDYNGQKIQLASNNEILPGGCFIDGDYGSVDARVDSQVESVLETMTEIQLDQFEETTNDD